MSAAGKKKDADIEMPIAFPAILCFLFLIKRLCT